MTTPLIHSPCGANRVTACLISALAVLRARQEVAPSAQQAPLRNNISSGSPQRRALRFAGRFRALIAIFAVAVVCLIALFPLTSSAQTFTNVWWKPSALGGTGTWNSGNAFWSTNSDGSGTLASPTTLGTNIIYNFSGTAGTVTENSSFTNAGINWVTTGYTWTSGANRTLTGTDQTASGTNTIYITNNANLTITGSGFTFDALTMTGGTGATLTLSNAAGASTTNIFGTTSAKGGRTNFVNTIIAGAGTNVLGTQAATTGFTQAGNITNNTSGMLVLTNSASGTATFSGAISGSGALTLVSSGSGDIALNASNSYSGGTTVSGTGTGQIGLGNSFAFGTGTVTIAGAGTNYVRAFANNLNLTNAFVINNGSTLRLATTNSGWKSTLSGTISGSGGIYYAFSDSGLFLTGTNSSFGGGINIGSTGTLFVTSLGMAGSNSSIGTNGTITLSSSSGSSGASSVVWLGTSNESSDKTFSLSAISSSTSQGVKIYAGDTSQGGTNVTLTLSGAISSTSTNNKVVTLGAYNTNTLIVNGLINQTANFTNSVVIGVTGQYGTVVLGNTNNSFGGGVTMNAGSSSVNIVQVALVGSAGSNSSLGTNSTINIGGTSATGNNVLQYGGVGETSDKVINLAGTFGGATLDQSGGGNLKFTAAMTATGSGAKTLTLQGSTAGTGEIASNLSDLGGNVISLSKSGTGTWTMSGSNSYSGTTAISGGTLAVTGTNSGNGLITVAAGATFDLSGKLIGTNDVGFGNLSATLKIGQTNGLANAILLGSASSASVGTVVLSGGGTYVVGAYGKSNSAGGNMNFSNSSGLPTTLTFTSSTNFMTLSSQGSAGRALTNLSADLTIVFGGTALDIGSSTNNDATFAGSGNYIVNASVINTNVGVRDIIKSGTGALTLNAANSYNGVTTVSGGTLRIGNGGSLGTTNNGTTVANGAALELTNGISVANESLTIGGSGVGNGGALRNLGGDNTYGGVVTLSTNTRINADAGILRLTNGTISGAFNLTLGGAANVAVSSVIGTSTGSLTKDGAGTVTLSGSNNYTGATTISNGTVELAGTSGGSAGSTASVSIASGAKLLLSQSGQVNDAATVSLSGGTIERGSGVTETFGNLALTAASFLDYGTGTASSLNFGTYTGGGFKLTVNNFLQDNVLTFKTDLTGTINNTSLFDFDNAFTSGWDSGASTFTITAVPETSTLVAACGLVALCLWPLRRRCAPVAKSLSAEV